MHQVDREAGYELLSQVAGLELYDLATEYTDRSGGIMRISFRIDEEDVETSAFGLIFALGVMSFHDARPRGVSEMHFVEKDEWHVGDMLRHLRYEYGMLRFYADYVRGRMMKTSIEIDQDSVVKLQTVGRARVAEGWVARLQGKQKLKLLPHAE